MNIEALNNKIELIQWLSSLEDSSIIEKLVRFRKEETKDWWNSSSEEEKTSIKKGLSDSNEGKLEPQSEIKKIYEKWL